MSLATDILKRAGIDLSPPPPKQVHTLDFVQRLEPEKSPVKPVKQRKTRQGVKYSPPGHEPIKGVGWLCDRRMWRAVFCYKGRHITVGIFPTQARAAIAYKLYAHWVNIGLELAPTRTEKRLYTRWRNTD